MVNVKITNGTYFTEEDYEAFKDDYINSSLTVKCLMEKHGLTEGTKARLVKRIVKETGYCRSTHSNREPRYYSYYNGRYHVSKRINGGTVNFGSYSSEDEARLVVGKLNEIGWDKSQWLKIKR